MPERAPRAGGASALSRRPIGHCLVGSRTIAAVRRCTGKASRRAVSCLSYTRVPPSRSAAFRRTRPAGRPNSAARHCNLRATDRPGRQAARPRRSSHRSSRRPRHPGRSSARTIGLPDIRMDGGAVHVDIVVAIRIHIDIAAAITTAPGRTRPVPQPSGNCDTYPERNPRASAVPTGYAAGGGK
jgi:hypothetical protein